MSKKRELTRKGILIEKSFISSERAKILAESIDKVLPTYLTLYESRTKKNYRKLNEVKRPLLYIRDKSDGGLVDVWHLDEKIKCECPDLVSGVDDLITELFPNEGLYLSSINMYITKGVTETRGFHADNFKDDFKVFLYLTDVELEDGPYCYEVGSQRRRLQELLNIVLAKSSGQKITDKIIVSKRRLKTVTGRAGDLIISNQRGSHRGLPQGENGLRKVMVFRYLWH